MTDNAIQVIESPVVSLMPSAKESAQQAVDRQLAVVTAINMLVDRTFIRGVDYDTIPGTTKDTLLLPGIEKTMGLLGLREEFHDIETVRQFDPENPFFYYEVECVLIHSTSGMEMARGQGVCHTREKSFMRQQSRVCPSCGEEAIIKGKAEYGGGWLCWKTKGGCGSKFKDGDETIESQTTGMVNDPQQVWDGINRARKIANKRAKADAVKRIGMLSERFTVDLEEYETPQPTPAPSNAYTGNGSSNQRKQEPEPPQDPQSNTSKDTDFWTLLYTDEEILKLYNGSHHIANAMKQYSGDAQKDGLAKAKAFLIDRKNNAETNKSNADLDSIPF